MATATYSFKAPQPRDGTGNTVNEGSDIPTMRARHGRRGSDREMLKLLESAQKELAYTPCSFWACNGPSRPKSMCTCGKCWSMREIGTVISTLRDRID